jgi:hypothetical protein
MIRMRSFEGRNKARDDDFFNCRQEHEDYYVSRLYESNQDEVHEFLEEMCKAGKISYSTHKEVYQMIEAVLGYPVPVDVD